MIESINLPKAWANCTLCFGSLLFLSAFNSTLASSLQYKLTNIHCRCEVSHTIGPLAP